ncbi:glycoside hydrolase family 32 protein [Joostella atrarenae]|uniref:Glycoside hydrolase family 32 protein n=1 Tax=Joostella atrarenae TaxID=679257 RepID=A0ABS9J0M3_9FLAO|nr:glycoside hydrolase family 32 protein [Joostella atrarenae]MCF8713977.1 glycoside hydrolase family 32 protein [Joostella atrarenae]
MKKYNVFFIGVLLVIISFGCEKGKGKIDVTDKISDFSDSTGVRPNFHFTPPNGWMNDPNGLVYNKGKYHLFYQHFPDSTVWGPMHWGHATSTDLLNWKHQPIAIYPDSIGYIFSGSAVLDKNNSSGLGTSEASPIVAMYTYHDPVGEKSGANNYQTQGIAYSIDNGASWEKYANNPVIGNEGIKDFRDPKVFWDEETNKWILLLVAGDHLKIYNSDNLIDWVLLSEFGKENGAHGGVWECPDLFKLKVSGTDEEKWVLLISINPGGPNGGSATQYFVGDFDGNSFTPSHDDIRWVDMGADNYAGVTYNNVPDGKRIFIGWMSNWNYGQATPTQTWRSAMTIPRELTLSAVNGAYILKNYPIDQFNSLREKVEFNLSENKDLVATENFNQNDISFMVPNKGFELYFTNSLQDTLALKIENGIFEIDRSKSGVVDFADSFADKPHQMPVNNLPEGLFEVRLIQDVSSIEIFINKGQYVMTEQVFPRMPYTNMIIKNTPFKNLEIFKIKSTITNE